MKNVRIKVFVEPDGTGYKIRIEQPDGVTLNPLNLDRMKWILQTKEVRKNWEVSCSPKDSDAWPFKHAAGNWDRPTKFSGPVKKEIEDGTYRYSIHVRMRNDHSVTAELDPDIVIDRTGFLPERLEERANALLDWIESLEVIWHSRPTFDDEEEGGESSY